MMSIQSLHLTGAGIASSLRFDERLPRQVSVTLAPEIMTLASLTPEEREVVRRTMRATFRFFDVDFQTRLGIAPDAMRSLLAAWPTVDDTKDDSDACLAVNNSFNDLLHGVGISEAEALELVGVSRAEMGRVYRKWANARGWDNTGVR